MDASVRFDTEIVGALPVIAHYLGRLGLGAVINEVVPWEGGVPLGTVAEIMIANRPSLGALKPATDGRVIPASE